VQFQWFNELVTHDPGEALRIADRIAVLRDGEIVQLGTPQELLAHPADAGVADFFADHVGIGAVASPEIKRDAIPETPIVAVDPSAPATLEAPRTRFSILRSALPGPVAFAERGHVGAFWACLLIEFATVAWCGMEWRAGVVPLTLVAALVWVASRGIAARNAMYAAPSQRSSWLAPLLLLLAADVLVGAHALGSNLGPFTAFPASLKIASAISDSIDRVIDWAQVSFEAFFACIVVVVRSVVDAIEFGDNPSSET